MENVLTTAISLTLMLYAMLTLSFTAINGAQQLGESWQQMETRLSSRSATLLSVENLAVTDEGAVAAVILCNDGATQLSEFAMWDVFVEYYDAANVYHIGRLGYLEAGEPITNEWVVQGIYNDPELVYQEAFNRSVLDPGECISLRIRLLPEVGEGAPLKVTLAAENGVGISAVTIYEIGP